MKEEGPTGKDTFVAENGRLVMLEDVTLGWSFTRPA